MPTSSKCTTWQASSSATYPPEVTVALFHTTMPVSFELGADVRQGHRSGSGDLDLRGHGVDVLGDAVIVGVERAVTIVHVPAPSHVGSSGVGVSPSGAGRPIADELDVVGQVRRIRQHVPSTGAGRHPWSG